MNLKRTDTEPCHYVDSHCHLDFSEFDGDRASVWQNCRELGVRACIVPGVTPEQWASLDKLSQHSNTIYYSVGLHPWWIGKYLPDMTSWDEKIDRLNHIQSLSLDAENCVAVGECGLDATIETPLDQQQHFFSAQVVLAKKYQKPLIIHNRKAHNEIMALIKKIRPERGGVIHGFSGSEALARRYIAMGFFIGVGGTITYSRAQKTRDAVRKIPLTGIVLETDAPDMPLCGQQGKRNSPQNIPMIAKTLADIRGESLAKIASQTTKNAIRLFGLPDCGPH